MNVFRSVPINLYLFGSFFLFRLSHRHLIISLLFLKGMFIGFLNNSLTLLLSLSDLSSPLILTLLVRYTDNEAIRGPS